LIFNLPSYANYLEWEAAKFAYFLFISLILLSHFEEIASIFFAGVVAPAYTA